MSWNRLEGSPEGLSALWWGFLGGKAPSTLSSLNLCVQQRESSRGSMIASGCILSNIHPLAIIEPRGFDAS